MSWQADAECRGLTHLFFPRQYESNGAKFHRELLAKSVCAACPVQAECDEAAEVRGDYGMWAGVTEEERAKARKARKSHPLLLV